MKKTMKLIALFVCAMATVALTGCGKDPKDLIIGKWNVDKTISTMTLGDEVEVDEEAIFASFEFKADGTGTVVGYEEEDEDVKAEAQLVTLPMTWTMNDAQTMITITVEGDSMPFTIAELTKSKCTLTADIVFIKLEVMMTRA